MAKVTLVRCPSLFAGGALTLSATPPIGVAYVAGSLREDGHDIAVVDGVGEDIENVYDYENRKNLFVNGLSIENILERIPKDSQYIGVSLPFSHEWPLGKKVCVAIRNQFPNAVIFAGGEHATAVPEYCLNDCSAIDYCILGESEETTRDLINKLEDGRPAEEVAGIALRCGNEIMKSERRSRMIAIDDIPRPAWDLVPIETYLAGGYSYGVNLGRTIPLIATRGCPFQCTFCSNPLMWTTRWLARDPLKVVEEMEDYIKKYNVSNFDFYDLTAVVRKDWTIQFCQLLIERNLNITWQLPSGTRSEALDSEVTELLYKSGCRNLTYAPESGSPEILKLIKKKIKPERMIESMKASITNNINIKANIIVGFPGEQFKHILETYKFIIRMAAIGVHDVSVWTFSAYPGSEIFSDLQAQKKIPEFSDEYFFSLLSYSDLKKGVSWNEHFPNWQLKILRLFGLVIFYATSYTLKPVRLFRTISNIFKHAPQSRLEMIVEKALKRHKKESVREQNSGVLAAK